MEKNALLMYWETKFCKDVNSLNVLGIKFLTDLGGFSIITLAPAVIIFIVVILVIT